MSSVLRRLEARSGLGLGIILAIGALLRVAIFFDLWANDLGFDAPPLDAEVFLDWALRISRGGELLGDRPFFLNPLYPYAIAPIVGLAGPHALAAIRVAQALLGLATIALVYGAARRFLGVRVALGAALLAALNPLLLFYEEMPMIVALATCTNALALYLLARFADTRRPAILVWAGLALGLSVLARPNVFLFVLAVPLWFLLLARGRNGLRAVAIWTGLVALGVLAPVLPVTVRNWVVGGDLVPVTSSMGLNLWQSNNPEGWRTGRMISSELRSNPIRIENDSILIAEKALGHPLKPSEVSGYWADRTFEAIANSPAQAARHLVRKALLFLNRFELPSSFYYEIVKQHTALLRWIPFDFGLLAPLALLGVILTFRKQRGGLLFTLFFAAYGVGLTVFYPLAHYRAPVLVAVFPLAALGLARLLAAAADRDRWALIRALALVAVFACLVHAFQIAGALGARTVLSQHEKQAPYWYNRGVMLLAQGRDVEAEAAFERVARVASRSWLSDLGLASVARKRGDLAREATHLENALSKKPDDALILAYLGRNRFHRGDRNEGLRLAETARDQDPLEPNIRAILAESYISVGRTADALGELEAEERYGLVKPANLEAQAWCLRHLGRVAEADARLERGLRMFPGSTLLLREKERLREALP